MLVNTPTNLNTIDSGSIKFTSRFCLFGTLGNQETFYFLFELHIFTKGIFEFQIFCYCKKWWSITNCSDYEVFSISCSIKCSIIGVFVYSEIDYFNLI